MTREKSHYCQCEGSTCSLFFFLTNQKKKNREENSTEQGRHGVKRSVRLSMGFELSSEVA